MIGPKENPAQGTRWGLSPACSEPRPRKLLVADEILTFPQEAAFENECIDKSDGTSGHCTEHVGAKSAQTSLGQATSQLKDDAEIPLQQADLERGLDFLESASQFRI